MEQQMKEPEQILTFTVAECGEFHSLGEYHDELETIEEAIECFKGIDGSRMNGRPSIGVNLHTEGTEDYEDVQMDILTGNTIDVDMLLYVPELREHEKVLDAIETLKEVFPNFKVMDMDTKETEVQKLAAEIDQLSYDIDTYHYKDTVSDREEQVQTIVSDLKNGNVEYLSDFLKATITTNTQEALVGMIEDPSAENEARGNMQKAKELLDRLDTYRPLVKVEVEQPSIKDKLASLKEKVSASTPDKGVTKEKHKEETL